MTFLEAFENWVMNQEPEEFPDVVDMGDGLTIADVQAELIAGGHVTEVYEYFSGEPVVRVTLSNGLDYYMEGTMNDVNSELWD